MLTKIFQRKTQSTSFIPEIDGLRFFAIITVMIFHVNTAYSRAIGLEDLGMNTMGGERTLFSPAWWIVRLDLGVKVFFSISGMVLALPFFKYFITNGKKVIISEYFIRRLTRLEPPFIVSLVGFFLVHILFMGENIPAMMPHFIAGLFYMHQLLYGIPNPINPVTWSLEAEAQFYILVPALFALLYRFNRKWQRFTFIFILLAGSMYFKKIAYAAELKWLHASIPYFLTNFAAGVFLAWFYIFSPRWFKLKSLGWDLIGFISILGLFLFYKPQFNVFNNLLFNVATVGMIIAVFKGCILNWFFTRSVIYIIGGMCYSIYLLHYALLHLFIKFTSSISLGNGYLTDLGFQIMIAFPAVMFVSSIFYLLIEKPCMDRNWPMKLGKWIQSTVQRAKT